MALFSRRYIEAGNIVPVVAVPAEVAAATFAMELVGDEIYNDVDLAQPKRSARV